MHRRLPRARAPDPQRQPPCSISIAAAVPQRGASATRQDAREVCNETAAPVGAGKRQRGSPGRWLCFLIEVRVKISRWDLQEENGKTCAFPLGPSPFGLHCSRPLAQFSEPSQCRRRAGRWLQRPVAKGGCSTPPRVQLAHFFMTTQGWRGASPTLSCDEASQPRWSCDGASQPRWSCDGA